MYPVSDTTTQRGAMMSSFETQQFKDKNPKPNKKYLKVFSTPLVKDEDRSIILRPWCVMWGKVKCAWRDIWHLDLCGIGSGFPSNTKKLTCVLHMFRQPLQGQYHCGEPLPDSNNTSVVEIRNLRLLESVICPKSNA